MFNEEIRNRGTTLAERISWKFRIGDVVEYKEDRARGVILRCLTSWEVESDAAINGPWYLILWLSSIHDVQEDNNKEYSLGQEHEGQLRLVHRCEFIT